MIFVYIFIVPRYVMLVRNPNSGIKASLEHPKSVLDGRVIFSDLRFSNGLKCFKNRFDVFPLYNLNI